MLIYACKFQVTSKDKYQFYVGKNIKELLNPENWYGVKILEIVMFKVHDTFNLKKYENECKCESMEVLCQEMTVLQS